MPEGKGSRDVRDGRGEVWDKSYLYYWNLNGDLSGATECTNDVMRWDVPPCWVFYCITRRAV